MSYDKRLHRNFPGDLAAGTAYYDDISVDLGNRFRERVRVVLEVIGERPESFGMARDPLRFAMVEGFPYLVLFRVIEETVYIAGLYHASSDPDKWLERA